MKALKFPYTQADIAQLSGKSELDALVAYMQKLGSDIPWRKTARAEVLGELKNPFQDNLAVLPEGKALYQQHCAQCHGKGYEGDVGPGLQDMDKPDSDVFTTIYSGKVLGGMPAFGDSLGKDRIWKLVTFLKSIHRH
jgi:cytochrome c oxidase cbb3-type subunit 2